MLINSSRSRRSNASRISSSAAMPYSTEEGPATIPHSALAHADGNLGQWPGLRLEAGVTHASVELSADLELRARALEGRPNEVLTRRQDLLIHRGGRRGCGHPLLECDDTTGPHRFRDEPQGSGRLAHVHEHEPSDRRIKESPAIDRPSIRDAEGEVGDPQRGAPVVRQTDGIGVEIDSDHRPLAADELAHEKADVTRTAADVRNRSACSINRSYSAFVLPSA